VQDSTTPDGGDPAVGVPDGGLITFEVRVSGVGPWAMPRLAEYWARELLRRGVVVGVRVNGGPELTR
jgi:hypothetical protein